MVKKMEIRRVAAPENAPLDRIYIVEAILSNFHGHRNVEAHIYRAEEDDGALKALRGQGLVGEADPRMPEAALAGASEDAALACILEAFTSEECDQIAGYLQARYSDQIVDLMICPLQLPVPLGIGPLSKIPEGEKSGFIYFDQARNYSLPFKIRAYYELPDDLDKKAATSRP